MDSLDYPQEVLALITHLKQLPGIGLRGAERMALWMLQSEKLNAEKLAAAIVEAISSITRCRECGFFAAGDLCAACSDPARDHRCFCVVEQATDILPIERSSAYHGLYHCLGGKLSPLDDVEPEDLAIDSLLERVKGRENCEVIIATGSDVEGEATATYLTGLLKAAGCKVTRIAQGIPAGAGLGHADALTLMKALQGRTEIH